MKYEKSCGAIVFLKESDKQPKLLLLRHRHGGHWSFPKGHVENDETEHQTATREVLEETGIKISFVKGFRHTVCYSPKPGVRKQVVYFLAVAKNEDFERQEEEISEICWMEPRDAYRAVTFSNDRVLISKATAFWAQQHGIV